MKVELKSAQSSNMFSSFLHMLSGPSSSPSATQLAAVIATTSLIASALTYTLTPYRSPVSRGKQRAIDGESIASSDVKIVRPGVVDGIPGLIGNTPLVRLHALSELTGCELVGKAEFLNPGGSPKDRVALQILLDAERSGLTAPHHGDCIFEGTVGSTGISLATLCRAKGYRCFIVLPDDVAKEKRQLLEKLGAEVKLVRPRGIVDPRHFVNEARRLASTFGSGEGSTRSGHDRTDLVKEQNPTPQQDGQRPPRGYFADQFETDSNFQAHFTGTGPEIWTQCGGSAGPDSTWPRLDAFVAGAGTGGTLSGVAAALREREWALAQKLDRNSDKGISEQGLFSWLPWSATPLKNVNPAPHAAHEPIRIVLADPQGSGLFNKVNHGVLYSSTEAEGTRSRHQVDTIVEGIGMNRITRNLSFGIDLVDNAVSVKDEEAVRMSRWLSVKEGLFLGSSSAVNVIAAVKTGMKLKQEWVEQGKAGRPTVVTILCDSGARHLSKFHNDAVLASDYNIHLPQDPMDIDISDLLVP